MHVLPDFHGNRSPLADPRALGTISGLSLDSSFDALCRSTGAPASASPWPRAMLDACASTVSAIETLHVAGGHARNPLLMALYADATGCRTVEPAAPDAVLLGTAMAAAAGAGLHPTLAAAGAAMHQGGTIREPDPPSAGRYERDWPASWRCSGSDRSWTGLPAARSAEGARS